MGRKNDDKPRPLPALDPEARENQLIAQAINLFTILNWVQQRSDLKKKN